MVNVFWPSVFSLQYIYVFAGTHWSGWVLVYVCVKQMSVCLCMYFM